MATRKAKLWKINPNINIDKFELEKINSNNLVNSLLVFKQSDLTFSVIIRFI